jgi:hypothetical protein
MYSKRIYKAGRGPEHCLTCKGLVAMVARWAGFSRAAYTSGVSNPRAWAIAETGLDQVLWTEGMKRRRRCDEMSRGIGQCVEMVKLLIFEPTAYAILTTPTPIFAQAQWL